jgi:hypothetical protein
MTDDDALGPEVELQAMGILAGALKELSPASRLRVLRWALDLYGRGSAGADRASADSSAGAADALTNAAGRKIGDFSELGEMYAAAAPTTDAEKALVIATWMQLRDQCPDVDTQAVNTKLKHLGYPIGNITRAFDSLRDARPSLVMQMKKMGTSQQARKKFRVTLEGQKEVDRMLSKTI